METDYITNQWIIDNFDLDKERRTKSVDSPDTCVFLDETHCTLSELINRLEEAADKIKVGHPTIPDTATCHVMIPDPAYEFDSLKVYVYWKHEVPETDGEVISRIRHREKQKIKRQARQKQEKELNAKQEQTEKQLLKKLIAKYGVPDSIVTEKE